MILMIYSSFSTFVRVDCEILSKKYIIKKYWYRSKKSILSHFISQVKLFFWLAFNIRDCEILYIWFADYHSFFPVLFGKIFKKNIFLVLGGYDVTNIREYNYGSFNNPIRAYCARFSIQNATCNFAVSDNIKDDGLRLVPRANIEIIYTGYSPNKFVFEDNKKKYILTVCEASTLQRAYIKGADLFFEVASKLPDIQFGIVALDEKLARNNFNIPDNIDFINHLSQDKLIKYYQNSSVYLQLSLREGLPNSVCEAMLCGCIPVGTNAGGIPIAIGSAGYISEKRDAQEISELIKTALNANKEKRIAARNRIIKNFPLKLREEKILTYIDKIINRNESF